MNKEKRLFWNGMFIAFGVSFLFIKLTKFLYHYNANVSNLINAQNFVTVGFVISAIFYIFVYKK